jgi:hypothetical protein
MLSNRSHDHATQLPWQVVYTLVALLSLFNTRQLGRNRAFHCNTATAYLEGPAPLPLILVRPTTL